MSAADAILPTGERVVITAYANGPEYCGAPFDPGRTVCAIKGRPRPGEKMVQVRLEDRRLEWWPSRSVKSEHAERVHGALSDFMRRRG